MTPTPEQPIPSLNGPSRRRVNRRSRSRWRRGERHGVRPRGEQLSDVAGAGAVVEPALLRSQQQTYLSDGLTLGIVLLVVPFGFIVGWILRSRLLSVNAGAVLSYILLTCILNGYLIYWPTALGWTRELLTCASAISFVLFLAYFRVLLQVSQLPKVIGWSYWVPLLGCIVGRLWWLKIDSVQGAQIVQMSLFSFYGVLLGTLFMAWRRRLSYSWMAWLVPGLLVGQLLMRIFFPQEQLPWQSPETKYSLSSTLAGVVLLVCTLIMEVARSRNREKQALSSLEQQRQAEHERLESTVALRTSQLRESLAARSALMARISHDLRSPLVRIIDYARLLHAGPNRDYQATIERNARQQLELIDEMLEFSRGELEQMQLALAPGYLYGFLEEIAGEAGFLAARQGNTFEAVLAEDLPPLVEADFKRLRQILMNLLANAAKFTRNGQIRFEVSATPGATADTVELRFSVIDSGIGIDPQEFEQLLQPFRRGRNAQRYEGSGLGLSIVTQLLERMDSRLEPQATEQGSHFSFRLPLKCAQEHDLEIGIVDNNATPLDGQGKHVLLVDDIEQNSEWLYDLLAGYGFDVSMAATGERLGLPGRTINRPADQRPDDARHGRLGTAAPRARQWARSAGDALFRSAAAQTGGLSRGPGLRRGLAQARRQPRTAGLRQDTGLPGNGASRDGSGVLACRVQVIGCFCSAVSRHCLGHR